jgi:hypothetical protein
MRFHWHLCSPDRCRHLVNLDPGIVIVDFSRGRTRLQPNSAIAVGQACSEGMYLQSASQSDRQQSLFNDINCSGATTDLVR